MLTTSAWSHATCQVRDCEEFGVRGSVQLSWICCKRRGASVSRKVCSARVLNEMQSTRDTGPRLSGTVPHEGGVWACTRRHC